MEVDQDSQGKRLAMRNSPARVLHRVLVKYWSWAAVLALAIVLWLPRLSGPIDLRYDAGVYYLLGTSLAAGHGYRIPSEPGSPQALQYPPLLPAIVAVYQKALGTSDPAIVAQWLRRSYAVLFAVYALTALALAKRFLPCTLAVVTVVLCLFHRETIFLCDLLFAELPFAVVAIAFALLAGNFRSSPHSWLSESASFILATTGFLLRTAGLALLVAWVLEALTRWKWRTAFARAAFAVIPVVAWQAYVSHVRRSDHYAHPAYEYQRAPYQYYNVSYAENVSLVDPFKPELGHVTPAALVSRLTTNSAQLLEAFGEVVSTSKAEWRRLVNRLQRKLFHKVISPSWFIFVPIFFLAAFVISGFFILSSRNARLIVLLLLVSVGLVLTTPWPAQFLRYLSPLIIFLDLCFILALSSFGSLLAHRESRHARALARAAFVGVLAVAFGTEAFTALRLYHFRGKPEAIVFDPRKGRSYRLFAHDETWRSWEKAVDWINTNAPRDAIIATTAPHFCYLLTGLRAVLPPMEKNPAEERRLLASVPVSYAMVDQLEFLNTSRRYLRPALESDPRSWRLVHTTDGTSVYERTQTAVSPSSDAVSF
jgi:hypothetical protein